MNPLGMGLGVGPGLGTSGDHTVHIVPNSFPVSYVRINKQGPCPTFVVRDYVLQCGAVDVLACARLSRNHQSTAFPFSSMHSSCAAAAAAHASATSIRSRLPASMPLAGRHSDGANTVGFADCGGSDTAVLKQEVGRVDEELANKRYSACIR